MRYSLPTTHMASMRTKLKSLAASGIAALLSVASLAAADTDLRLVQAVKNRERGRETVPTLLSQHVDVNAAQDGATALSWAAHWDDLETAELLVRAGANVNMANDYGVTALSLACTNGSAAMVDMLLKAGANPNAALWTGETVLMTCSRTGNVDAVKSLLARGAEVNAKEAKKGQTALMWAVQKKHSEVARLLIERGADIHARSKGDFVEARFLPAGRASKADAQPTATGFTPLLFAAQQGDVASARILLAAGADVNESTQETGSALVVAAASGHEAFALFMLEQGANPNVADSYGVTPMHFAVQEGLGPGNGLQYNPSYRPAPPSMPGLVKALLSRGANPNARITKDYPGNTFFYRAPRLSLVGATPFWVAAAAYDANIMRILLEVGADPLLATAAPPATPGKKVEKNDDGEYTTPPDAPGVEKATKSRDSKDGKDNKDGKDSKASADSKSGSQPRPAPAATAKWGVTPLMAAAGLGTGLDYVYSEETEKKALEAVELALKLGNDVNAVSDSGRTAMHGAALMGANRIVQLLADKGAKVDVKDRNGFTPWALASGLRNDVSDNGALLHPETAALLLKMGADPKVGEELAKMRAAYVAKNAALRETAIAKPTAAKKVTPDE